MVNGRRVAFSLHTDSPADAARRLEAAKRRLIAEVHHGGDGIKRTFDDAMERWENHLDNRMVGANTRKRYAVSIGRMFDQLEGKPLEQIKGRLIADIVRSRRAEGVSNATIKRDLVALSSIVNCAVAEGWLEANPVLAQLKGIRERRDPIVLPKRDHIALVLERAPGMIKDMIEAAARTGAREAELLNARRSQIDHERRQKTLYGKGNKRRTISLDPIAGYDLMRSLPAYVSNIPAGATPLFWHGAGETYKNFASQFAAIVKRTAEWAEKNKVEFRPFRFHDLRHFHAVEWLKSGRSIYDLQQRLGHSSLKVTEMYLEYLTPDEIRTAKGERAA
jgi:integrase/recombinase XerD